MEKSLIGSQSFLNAKYANHQPLSKHCTLHFKALTGVKAPYTVKWQITNIGDFIDRDVSEDEACDFYEYFTQKYY